MDAGDVSNEHASLRWRGTSWELRDLGSRNGTYVNGTRLQPGDGVTLRRDAVIRFGATSAPWQLVDDGPPLLAALELQSRSWVRASGNLLGLPNEDAPLASIFHVSEGGWICQQPDEARPVRNGEVIALGSQRWQLHLTETVVSTAESQAGEFQEAGPRLVFAVSRDEEYVELSVALPGLGGRSLGARAHHYLLLLLARQHARDTSDAALSRSEQGWIHLEELGKMVHLDRAHLYVMIHRARRQFADVGVPDAASVVEYRPRTGMVRLGFRDFELQSL